MTVRELIELNQMITDIEITVRLNGTRLLDQLNIGCAEGVKPPFPTRVPINESYINNYAVLDHEHHRDATYIPKSINAFDDGKDYWQIKTSRIPSKWLDLEVISWSASPASKVGTTSPRRGRTNFNGIRVGIDVLPSGESLEIKDKEPKKSEEIEGQMTFDDYWEESENG